MAKNDNEILLGFSAADIESARQIAVSIQNAAKIVITCHLSPDGDAAGASMALMHALSAMGKKVRIVTPDEMNHTLRFLPGAQSVTTYSRNPEIANGILANADVLFCLDYNEPSRISRLEPALRNARGTKILIDHHIGPELEAFNIAISKPERSSTCSLLYSVLTAAGLSSFIGRESAECLMAGMMTDTNNFSHNANHVEDYYIQAQLLERGANKNALWQRLFNVISYNSMKLNAYAIEKMEVFNNMHGALITLTREELNRFEYKKGDTEGLVNRPLAIPGIYFSCYLREENDYIKVSMRSVGDISVKEICEKYFHGGGHKNAAGGEFPGTMDDCAGLFRSILPEINKCYISE